MTDRTDELGKEPIGRLLFRYSAPAMFAMFVNSLYNLVDTIFVGLGVGTLALGGMAISWPIHMVIVAVAQLVGIGSASIISRSLGAGDPRKAARTAGTSFVTVGALCLCMAVVGIIFLKPLLRRFGATEAILPYAWDYLSILLLGSFFFGFSISTNGVVRSEGNVKLAMVTMIIGASVNIVLDPIFIFGLNMGIRGAAVATVIANICSFSFLCRYFLSGKSMLKIRRGDLVPDFSILPEVFKIGAPSFIRMISGSAMAIVVNNLIAYYGEDVHMAIMGVTNRATMFFFMPIFGLVQGLQPIIGFNYGAKNMPRVIEAVKKGALTATALSTAAFLILMLAPETILSMFSRDPELISEGAVILRIMVIFMPFVGFQMVGGSLFQALGKAFPALVLTLSRQILILIPLLFILPRLYGLTGLWCAFPIADFASAILTSIWVVVEIRALGRHSPPAGLPEEVVIETVSGGG